ncbi:hypothetical protein CEXT_22971 [Caerostris extrusa]|uniref:Uncharacterized protein n=1 Tax=Caerostris extrusa TaxID=172846 RepID=A0AAV4XF62_CAEEX|nr:hypothetical protein CEXT_22971 [Caerostris extrusa]
MFNTQVCIVRACACHDVDTNMEMPAVDAVMGKHQFSVRIICGQSLMALTLQPWIHGFGGIQNLFRVIVLGCEINLRVSGDGK